MRIGVGRGPRRPPSHSRTTPAASGWSVLGVALDDVRVAVVVDVADREARGARRSPRTPGSGAGRQLDPRQYVAWPGAGARRGPPSTRSTWWSPSTSPSRIRVPKPMARRRRPLQDAARGGRSSRRPAAEQCTLPRRAARSRARRRAGRRSRRRRGRARRGRSRSRWSRAAACGARRPARARCRTAPTRGCGRAPRSRGRRRRRGRSRRWRARSRTRRRRPAGPASRRRFSVMMFQPLAAAQHHDAAGHVRAARARAQHGGHQLEPAVAVEVVGDGRAAGSRRARPASSARRRGAWRRARPRRPRGGRARPAPARAAAGRRGVFGPGRRRQAGACGAGAGAVASSVVAVVVLVGGGSWPPVGIVIAAARRQYGPSSETAISSSACHAAPADGGRSAGAFSSSHPTHSQTAGGRRAPASGGGGLWTWQ